jgi:ribonuclease P protein component
VLSGTDFRTVVRSGRKVSTPHAVVYSTRTSEQSPTRFGFIVAKSVGGSVVRNRIRRRLKAIGRELLETNALGSDIIVRPLPGSADVEWSGLHSEITEAVHRSVTRR